MGKTGEFTELNNQLRKCVRDVAVLHTVFTAELPTMRVVFG